jgi:hypothetical protein
MAGEVQMPGYIMMGSNAVWFKTGEEKGMMN